jgi:hypothetical protein
MGDVTDDAITLTYNSDGGAESSNEGVSAACMAYPATTTIGTLTLGDFYLLFNAWAMLTFNVDELPIVLAETGAPYVLTNDDYTAAQMKAFIDGAAGATGPAETTAVDLFALTLTARWENAAGESQHGYAAHVLEYDESEEDYFAYGYGAVQEGGAYSLETAALATKDETPFATAVVQYNFLFTTAGKTTPIMLNIAGFETDQTFGVWLDPFMPAAAPLLNKFLASEPFLVAAASAQHLHSISAPIVSGFDAPSVVLAGDLVAFITSAHAQAQGGGDVSAISAAFLKNTICAPSSVMQNTAVNGEMCAPFLSTTSDEPVGDEESKKLSGSVVTGIVMGSVAALVAIGAIIYGITRKTRRTRQAADGIRWA